MEDKTYTQMEVNEMLKDAFWAARRVFPPYALEGNPSLILCQTDSGLRLVYNSFEHYLQELKLKNIQL